MGLAAMRWQGCEKEHVDEKGTQSRTEESFTHVIFAAFADGVARCVCAFIGVYVCNPS